jgi:threonine synthase
MHTVPSTNRFRLLCPACGREYDPGPRWRGCDTCVDRAGFPHWVEVRYDLTRVDAAILDRPGRLWDYAPLLPILDPAGALTLGEGGTPLLRIDSLNREIGLPNLHLKLESVNPTGSFKDRLHSVSMAVAHELGFERAVISTTGNSGVAAAAYAARYGIGLAAILHPETPPEARRLMQLFGTCVTIPDPKDAGSMRSRDLMERLVGDHGYYPCTLMGTFAGPGNPYGIEGYKTIACEVRAQLGRAPDRMCVPTSGGDALYGPFKGFQEMRELGLIDCLPRMTSCQPVGSSFIAQSLRGGLDHIAPVEPATFAISIGDPTGSEAILAAIDGSGGDAWEASDTEILEAMALLGRHGICVEGASAAPVAALRRQVLAGSLETEECIVAVLTGTGMKWMSQVAAASGPPAPPLPCNADSILHAMGRMS